MSRSTAGETPVPERMHPLRSMRLRFLLLGFLIVLAGAIGVTLTAQALANSAPDQPLVQALPELDRRLLTLVVLTVVTAAMSTVALWFVVRGLLATVHDVTRAAAQVTDGTLAKRIPVPSAGETGDLARAVNAMLDRLEALVITQRLFVRRTSHELRDPLTVCQGHLELLREGFTDQESAVSIVMDELGRMARIVDDLQVLADAGHRDFLLLADVDLEALIHELLVKSAAMGDRRWVLDAATSGVVRADRQRLTEAVLNLVHNAVLHTEAGGEIALGCSVAGDRWRLWVRDEGVGATPSPELFEPSIRGEGSRRRYQGSGLGLAIVKIVAESHGGTATLAGAPGEGFRVTLELPTRPELSATVSLEEAT